MPYVNVKVAGELTMDQKREIAKDISQTLEKNAKKPKASCYIVFEEIPRSNWAKGEAILDDVDKGLTSVG